MALNKFFNFEKSNKEVLLKKIMIKLKKDKHLSNIVALREAEKIVFKPENVERIKMNALKNIGYRPSITFFFNNKKDIVLMAKYFNINFSVMGVDDSSLLIDILNLLENTNEVE